MVVQEHNVPRNMFGTDLSGTARCRSEREVKALANFQRERSDTDFGDEFPSFDLTERSWHTVFVLPGGNTRIRIGTPDAFMGIADPHRRTASVDEAAEDRTSLVIVLRRRLDNVNRHFKRKAAAVFNDDAALTLLATLYENVVVETEEFDFCEHGRSLAKLAAANFCEVGANGIFITESGQRFIDNINAP